MLPAKLTNVLLASCSLGKHARLLSWSIAWRG